MFLKEIEGLHFHDSFIRTIGGYSGYSVPLFRSIVYQLQFLTLMVKLYKKILSKIYLYSTGKSNMEDLLLAN